MEIITSDNFRRFNNLGLLYAEGLKVDDAFKYKDRLINANRKAMENSVSVMDVRRFSELNDWLDKMEVAKEVSESSRLKVVGREDALEREVTTGKKQVMNSQVLINALDKDLTNDEVFEVDYQGGLAL